ncbi:MAG: hypothetical protein OEZ68_06075 [Gammaproteobacteria bacterium]|nr:hypothetical protein [Gammaproteobacteria bacterium]MDH5800356.1 hypothetical protein [Gammaproteobacteria bacterium]
MTSLKTIRRLFAITRVEDISRRYFVVNGFDGALTMLGLLLGFYVGKGVNLNIVIPACVGAAIALAMSGITSAYLSEKAERQKDLKSLQDAMVANDLSGSDHIKATRWVPVWVGLINGLSPLLISLFIISPLWMAQRGVALPADPVTSAIGLSFTCIFFLGVFLGRVSGSHWFMSGLQALLIALCTALMIFLIT